MGQGLGRPVMCFPLTHWKIMVFNAVKRGPFASLFGRPGMRCFCLIGRWGAARHWEKGSGTGGLGQT